MLALSPRYNRSKVVCPGSPVCTRLVRSKSSSTLDTEILNSVRKMDSRVKNLGKKINRLPGLKPLTLSPSFRSFDKQQQYKQKLDVMTVEYECYRREMDQKLNKAQSQLYNFKQKYILFEQQQRQNDKVVQRLKAQLECEKALKSGYHFQAQRCREKIKQSDDKKQKELDILKSKLDASQKEKALRDSQLSKMKEDFKVLKAEVIKLTEMVKNQ